MELEKLFGLVFVGFVFLYFLYSVFWYPKYGKVQCKVCGKEILYHEAHEIVHGIDSMSDSWSEFFCPTCPVPDCSHRMTAHNVR